MATDGADFKRRVKFHGKTYTEIKNGSSVETIAQYSVAGLARELKGDNPVLGLRELVLATADALQGILARDSLSLLHDLKCRHDQISAQCGTSEAQRIVVESLVREAGRLRYAAPTLDHSVIVKRLLSECGSDLHDALVIEQADQYAMHHRSLAPDQLPAFTNEWQRQASGGLDELMTSIFEHGRPEKHLTHSRRDLAPVKSDSVHDLTSINLSR